jgi:hypothetical protein
MLGWDELSCIVRSGNYGWLSHITNLQQINQSHKHSFIYIYIVTFRFLRKPWRWRLQKAAPKLWKIAYCKRLIFNIININFRGDFSLDFSLCKEMENVIGY